MNLNSKLIANITMQCNLSNSLKIANRLVSRQQICYINNVNFDRDAQFVKMCRLSSGKIHAVILFLSLFVIIVPVNSYVYKFIFDPAKFMVQCKNTNYDPIQKYFDQTNLNLTVASDNTLHISGYIFVTIDPLDLPLTVREMPCVRRNVIYNL